MTTSIILEDGKYEIIIENGVPVEVKRYGEPWRNIIGDRFIQALVTRLLKAEQK